MATFGFSLDYIGFMSSFCAVDCMPPVLYQIVFDNHIQKLMKMTFFMNFSAILAFPQIYALVV